MNENSTPLPGKDRNPGEDEQWVRRAVQQHYDQEVENLDFNVVNKLSAARHRALDQDVSGVGKAGAYRPRWSVLLAGSAALALAIVVGKQIYVPGVEPLTITAESISPNTSNLIEDLPLLSATEDIEFYQSLEFLEWMASNSG